MDDVAKLAGQTANSKGAKPPPGLAIVQGRRASPPAPSRYGHWFYGEKVAIRKLRPIANDMTAAEVAAATKENLALIGEETRKRITAKLPAGHNLYRAVRAATLRSAPHLGACKFGEIVTDYDHEKYGLMQVFLTNFAGLLDTSGMERFLTPVSRNYDQMFFGVHVQVDRAGNPLGFNRHLGSDGVAFQTRDLIKAFFHIASASTGISMKELQARAIPPRH